MRVFLKFSLKINTTFRQKPQDKYLIVIDSYWCFSSDLFLKIPLFGGLESSSMMTNFSTNITFNSDPVSHGNEWSFSISSRASFGSRYRSIGLSHSLHRSAKMLIHLPIRMPWDHMYGAPFQSIFKQP